MNEIQQQMQKRWNEKGWDYDQAGAHGVYNHEEKKEWMRLFENCEETLDVLDVGTGTGFVAMLAAEAGHKVTAIDWSSTMLSQAKSKAEEKNLEITFIEGVTESLPFENDSFQALTARHVLWTLAYPEQALAEWCRVVKPGGKIWVDYSPRDEKHGSHHYSADIEQQLPLNKNVAAEVIVELFVKAGFQEVKVTTRHREGNAHGHHQGHTHTTYLISAVKS